MIICVAIKLKLLGKPVAAQKIQGFEARVRKGMGVAYSQKEGKRSVQRDKGLEAEEERGQAKSLKKE